MTAEFAPLLEYLDRRFAAVERQMVELKGGFDVLQTSVDAYAKRADTFFQEMVALSHKVDRHERWLHQIAERLGVKLDY